MEDNLAFGFTADGGWLYNAPKQWSRWSLPQGIEDLFKDGKVKDIKCVAFGTTKDCYFLSWINKESETRFSWGLGCPKEFMSYLKDSDTGKIVPKASLQVVFGPNDSFFAWDERSIRWSKIPEGLEQCIQSGLGPAGWIHGPPRLVALGADGAWFSMSQYGVWAYSIPGTWTELLEDWEALNVKEICDKEGILAISFNASQADQYVIVMKEDFSYCYSVPEPVESVCSVIDSLAPENIQKERKEIRARLQKKKEEEDEARKESERCAKEDEEERAHKLTLHYVIWKSGYEASTSRDKTLTTFPHVPAAVCTCTAMSCILVKERDDSLKACQHDVEQLLRASGSYSLDWLRKERLRWHPDKFARHCDPDFRRILVGKATELYAIFEVLIEAEKPPV